MTFVEVLKKDMAVRELNENMAPDERSSGIVA
jgi:hypothetical protein